MVMQGIDRVRLIKHLDAQISPHRASFSRQITQTPLKMLRRIMGARLGQLSGRMGWTGDRQKRMFYGETLQFPVPACWDLSVYGTYIDEAELRLMKFLIRHLGHGDHMVDVGANIGFMCQLAALIVGPSGTVHGFEPGTQALRYLKENVGRSPNVSIIEKAAMDVEGSLTFYEGIGAAMVSSSTVASHTDGRDSAGVQEVTIQATTLDQHCDQTGTVPQLIKIDVEGAELSVLKGAEDVILRHRPWIVLEVSFLPEEYQSQYQPCVELLAKAGYEAYAISEDGEVTPLPDVLARAAYCNGERGYLHGLDNVAFVHPDRPLQDHTAA